MPLPTNKQVWEAVLKATKELPRLHWAIAQLDARQRKCKAGSARYIKLENDIQKYRREAEQCSTHATTLVWHKMNGPTFIES